MQQLHAEELATWLADESRPRPVLLDVREEWEYRHCHLPDSQLIPMGTVPGRLHEIDRGRDVVVVCHHGIRSYQVARFLEHHGFIRIYNLSGGVAAWSRDVDPSLPTY